MALLRDGEELRTAAVGQPALVDAKSVAQIWGDPAFGTLALGLALALFAQIGLLAHLVSLLVLTFGVQGGRLGGRGPADRRWNRQSYLFAAIDCTGGVLEGRRPGRSGGPGDFASDL